METDQAMSCSSIILPSPSGAPALIGPEKLDHHRFPSQPRRRPLCLFAVHLHRARQPASTNDLTPIFSRKPTPRRHCDDLRVHRLPHAATRFPRPNPAYPHASLIRNNGARNEITSATSRRENSNYVCKRRGKARRRERGTSFPMDEDGDC